MHRIGDIYEATMAKVTSSDGETDLFEILLGVLQRDTLASFLFVTVHDLFCFALRTDVPGSEEEALGFHPDERRSTQELGQK